MLGLPALASADDKVVVLVENHPLLTTPFGLDFLPDGSLVVADFGGHRVCKVTRAGEVSVLAGTGESGHRDGPASRARFNAPHTVAVLPGGDVLVADTLNHCVRRISARGTVSTVAGAPQPGFAGDGGPAREARFRETYHVCATPKGFLVADLGNRRIRAVEDGTIRTVAGNGQKGVPTDGSPAAASPLLDPRAVARGPDGSLWILERSGHALRTVDPEGRIRTVAGTGRPGPAADGPALKATLRGPKFVWVEKSGTVLIADTDNHCIRRYDPRSGSLITVVGTGRRGRSAAGGQPTATALDQPHGVAADGDGILYVSDSLNHRIFKVVVDVRPDGGRGLAGAQAPSDAGEKDDEMAVRAAWERLLLDFPEVTHHHLTEVSPNGAERFCGFIEGRLHVQIPDWWEEALRGANGFVRNNVRFERPVHWPFQKVGGRVALPRGTVSMKDDLSVLTVEQARVALPLDVMLDVTHLPGAQLALCMAGRFCFVAPHGNRTIPYRVYCLDPEKSKVVWKTAVVPRKGIRGWSGWGWHCVGLVATRASVVVFGAGDGVLYLQGLSKNEGKTLFRFNSFWQ
jgi:sugar lactone lactonase YvrE